MVDNRDSQHHSIRVNGSDHDFVVAMAGCMRYMKHHSTVGFLMGTWGQLRQRSLAADFFSISDDKLLVFQVKPQEESFWQELEQLCLVGVYSKKHLPVTGYCSFWYHTYVCALLYHASLLH